jgi:hypothetical protein
MCLGTGIEAIKRNGDYILGVTCHVGKKWRHLYTMLLLFFHIKKKKRKVVAKGLLTCRVSLEGRICKTVLTLEVERKLGEQLTQFSLDF